jgi:hypothetical protein
MSNENPDAASAGVERPAESEPAPAITLQLLGKSMVSGLAGMAVMTPVLLGLPVLLGVFRAEPLREFASIGSFFGLTPSLVGPVFGYDPTLVIGALIFALGGILFLPVQFIVVATFLPPESPRLARGATLALLWWGGFVFAFWPGGGLMTISLFIVLSFLAHLLYGLTLGTLVDRWAGGIPEHDV